MHARTRYILFGLACAAIGAVAGVTAGWHLRHVQANGRDGSPPGVAACTAYVDTAKSGWFVDAWGHDSLRIVPTACGRQIGSTDTPFMYYEIVKEFGDPDRFGASPSPQDHWKNSRGMINQLTCHLRIARDKPEWNIEPYRPWVGDEATEEADCNPYEH